MFEVFKQVNDLVGLNLITKEQKLSMDIDPALVVYADKDMIATIFRNLVFNAIKFSHDSSGIISEDISIIN